MTRTEKLYEKIAEQNCADTMAIRVVYQKTFIKGVYFDGVRPDKIKQIKEIADNMYCYECRASDNDPNGVPVTILPLQKIVLVNFAGTFVTDDLIPKLDKEKKIADYTYNPF